jgi:hypothetical protein
MSIYQSPVSDKIGLWNSISELAENPSTRVPFHTPSLSDFGLNFRLDY